MARVGRAHGLGGEVAVTFSSDVVERRTPGAVLFAGDRRLVVSTVRRHGRRWLVGFEGIDDRDGAEALSGTVLTATELGDADATGTALWVHEVVGTEVRDARAGSLGSVVAVQGNPAHDLLVLEDGTLIPSVFVTGRRPGIVEVELPPGLLEVNRSSS